jgi:alkanesulfonate monooxygenase SsuD/methylene tetrahydromethanopterin reductase-like flavin-dependent oxidoreductase (luciferase family)
VGGAPPHALTRAIRFGDGWMPMGVDPEKLRGPIAQLRRLAAEDGRAMPEVVAMGRLPLEEPGRAAEQLAALSQIGVTRLVHAERYPDPDAFQRTAERLAALAKG